MHIVMEKKKMPTEMQRPKLNSKVTHRDAPAPVLHLNEPQADFLKSNDLL